MTILKSPLFIAFVGIPLGAWLFAGAFVTVGSYFSPRPKVDFVKEQAEYCLQNPHMWERYEQLKNVYNVGDTKTCPDHIGEYLERRAVNRR